MSAEFVSGLAVLIGLGCACFPTLFEIASGLVARAPPATGPAECPACRCACEVSIEQATFPWVAFLIVQAILNLLFFCLGWCLRAGLGWAHSPPRRPPHSFANLRAALAS